MLFCCSLSHSLHISSLLFLHSAYHKSYLLVPFLCVPHVHWKYRSVELCGHECVSSAQFHAWHIVGTHHVLAWMRSCASSLKHLCIENNTQDSDCCWFFALKLGSRNSHQQNVYAVMRTSVYLAFTIYTGNFMNTIFNSLKPARHVSFYLEEKKAPKGSSLAQLVLAEKAFEATSDSLSMPFPPSQDVFSPSEHG